MNDTLAKQKLEDEIITVSLLCAHFEACDNILLNSNSLFTFKAKSHVNLIRKKVKHLIKDIEKRLSEEQVEELDMLCELLRYTNFKIKRNESIFNPTRG